MKAKKLSSILTVCALSFFALEATAQNTRPRTNTQPRTSNPRVARTTTQRSTAPRTPSANSSVAVVDVSYIFKNHKGFKASMDGMKKEVQAFETQLRADHEALSKDRMKLQGFKPGSQEYKALEASLADRTARLQVKTQQKKREFLEREALVYYDTYIHVRKAIQIFADNKGFSLVLRHTGDEINPNDRGSVLAGVNRAVVYHRGIDITTGVLSILDKVPKPPMNKPANTANRNPRGPLRN